MTQQIINVGTTANDGTGEGLREAFTAVNDNFTEVYTAGPVGSNVEIANNTISINGTNGNLILQGNGIGNVVTNSSVRPSIDAVFDLGNPNYRYDTVHAAYFQGNGSALTGITVSAGSQILNANSNVRIADSNAPVTVSVNGTANVAVFNSSNVTVAASIVPSANNAYNLGSTTQRFNDLYLSGSTINLGNSTISANASALTITNSVGGQTIFSGTGSSTLGGNITANSVSATGNITGAFFQGNGSLLTGVATTNAFLNVVANTANMSANTSSTLTFVPGANIIMTANTVTNTITFNSI